MGSWYWTYRYHARGWWRRPNRVVPKPAWRSYRRRVPKGRKKHSWWVVLPSGRQSWWKSRSRSGSLSSVHRSPLPLLHPVFSFPPSSGRRVSCVRSREAWWSDNQCNWKKQKVWQKLFLRCSARSGLSGHRSLYLLRRRKHPAGFLHSHRSLLHLL